MDFNSFQFDSYYEQVCGHIEWSADHCSKDLPQLEKSAYQDDASEDFFQSIEENITPDTNKNEKNDTRTSIHVDFEQNSESSISLQVKDSKTKNIFKAAKIKAAKIQLKSNHDPKNPLSNKAYGRMKSKYNNMGGFLIGTFSTILSNSGKYRFRDGVYQIEINKLWVALSKGNISNPQLIEKGLAMLKFKLSCLPRRDGSKKHIFDIINTGPFDSVESKISKSLLKKELIYSLSQEAWLLEHVKSRDFKPKKDDQLETKKLLLKGCSRSSVGEREYSQEDYLVNSLKKSSENLIRLQGKLRFKRIQTGQFQSSPVLL